MIINICECAGGNFYTCTHTYTHREKDIPRRPFLLLSEPHSECHGKCPRLLPPPLVERPRLAPPTYIYVCVRVGTCIYMSCMPPSIHTHTVHRSASPSSAASCLDCTSCLKYVFTHTCYTHTSHSQPYPPSWDSTCCYYLV